MSDRSARREAVPKRAESPVRSASPRPGRTEASLPPLGNQALQSLLRSGAIQAKLTISQSGDPYEREADRVADAVMRMPEPGAPAPEITPLEDSGIQRKCAACAAGGADCPECAKEEEQVQRKAEGSATSLEPDTSPVPHSGGQPLAAPVRSFFEPRFGRDFSNVRVHTGTEADAAARSIHALAYTHGRDIVFRSGQYSPDTPAGRHLLAHELTHTIQQTRREIGESTGVVPIQRVIDHRRRYFCPEGLGGCLKQCSNEAFGLFVECVNENAGDKKGEELDAVFQECEKQSAAWEMDCQIRRCNCR